ncbi:MAG: hypothetical protein RIB84_06820 [Sneathiellaceae bacterium]
MTSISFAPLLPWWLLAAVAAFALLPILVGLWRRSGGIFLRLATFALVLATLTNPSLVEEEREYLDDIAVVVIDESRSTGFGDRRAAVEAAAGELQSQLSGQKRLQVRTVRAGAADSATADTGTELFQALSVALADIPADRFAGAIMVTDGQVHDVPQGALAARLPGPIHGLIAGNPDAFDRRLTVVQAPGYGIVGNEVSVTLRVDQTGSVPAEARLPRVRVRLPDGSERSIDLPLGVERSLTFTIDRGGANVAEFSIPAVPGELTAQNNTAVAVINGVRDRLRVLLVTGEPHAGERVWRNLLKADPSVDLVHFTILRPPEKQDGTPIMELSLIAFPIRELFEVKVDEFDLIIFDRYRRRGILPATYLENIADYVRDGGALLDASGPAYAFPLSLWRTPLSQVLPGEPTGGVIVEGFRPELSELGRRHPVTAGLPGAGEPGGLPGWGRWFRLIDVLPNSGETLMTGPGKAPVLQLRRVGEGRVAQIYSDHAWLWARGFEGGGPQAELLRRAAHWLMKEPDLEEEALHAELQGQSLTVTRQSLEPDEAPVTITFPDGRTEQVRLEARRDGKAVGRLPVDEPGIYTLSDGRRDAIAAVGEINPRELGEVQATDARLRPVTQATGGGLLWLNDGPFRLRRVDADAGKAGTDWLGLTDNNRFLVTGLRQIALLPGLLVLALLLAGLLLAWRQEGR